MAPIPAAIAVAIEVPGKAMALVVGSVKFSPTQPRYCFVCGSFSGLKSELAPEPLNEYMRMTSLDLAGYATDSTSQILQFPAAANIETLFLASSIALWSFSLGPLRSFTAKDMEIMSTPQSSIACLMACLIGSVF